ncbi:hypothetical protein [Novosphingobium guangzhouense]|uniref:Uncharacterized protein n=1 Tax=Novosphingobium guangzhouense TaxID=1850347 RepID=A0A2K2G0P2_9SPHN|nr:hypothetical protein [Novosphingobium guangzhouense]PNU04620.1 hypothetical protein A8V01_19620 [Novosphingobium guangzhouense]
MASFIKDKDHENRLSQLEGMVKHLHQTQVNDRTAFREAFERNDCQVMNLTNRVRELEAQASAEQAYSDALDKAAEAIGTYKGKWHIDNASIDGINVGLVSVDPADIDNLSVETTDVRSERDSDKVQVIYDMLVDHFIEHAMAGGFSADKHLDVLVHIKGIIRR